MSLRNLVIDVGSTLGRSAKDVEPYIQNLKDNWYDSVDGIVNASADDLTAIGLPRRFAVDLLAAAAGGGGGGGGERKGKSKGKGKGKDKGKDREEDRGGKGKVSYSSGKSRDMKQQHTIGVDLAEVPKDSAFVFRPRIIGNGGANVRHIQDQTGANIHVEGWDTDGYLELKITAPDRTSLDKTVSMCDDLVNTVWADYDTEGPSKGKGKKGDSKGKGKKGKDKGKGKGKDKGKGKKSKGGRPLQDGETEERIPVPKEGLDSDFYLRRKLVGEDGANMKHIEGESNCYVSVTYDDGEGMEIVIQGADDGAISSAREMCEDLLANVLEEAANAPPKGEGKGKKGKRRDGEPPYKSSRTE